MEILSEAIELAQKVCGSQKPCPGEWRMAHHCVAVPCAEGMLLYHTLTGELLLLTEAEWAARNTDPDLREALFRRRFLVPADFDENCYADQVIRLAKLMNPPRKGITRFTVFDIFRRTAQSNIQIITGIQCVVVIVPMLIYLDITGIKFIGNVHFFCKSCQAIP